MSSFMEKIIAPYLTSPLANSTKIYNSMHVETESSDANYSRLYRKPVLDKENSTSEDMNILETNVNATQIASTSMNITTSKVPVTEKKYLRKSVGGKKPVVGRKVITAKKTVEPIKAVAINYQDKEVTVENILKQINMTKYYHSFKKIDVAKFRELKEIDLNAIGITRPSEIRIFMEAIKKAKLDLLCFTFKD